MDLTILAFGAAGIALLVLGAEGLVRGASRLALAAGVSPLVIGLTVVAYGTSAPEFVVSVSAGLEGKADIAVANVVGSNILNVLFILGACATLAPLVVQQQLVRLDVPIMISVSLLLWGLALDGRLDLLDGLVLVAGLVAHAVWTIRRSRRETAAAKAEYEREFGAAERSTPGGAAIVANVALVLVSLGVLVLGARWFVGGSVSLARFLGLSDAVIGLTLVAAGTSMPEVATSVVATLRGERDIAIGNVVGSNIYNILAILGVASVVTPGGLTVAPSVEAFDVPVMTAVAVACLPIFFTGHRIARWEGALFLAYYVAYTAYLILASQHHDATSELGAVMLEFALPLTAVTLLVFAVRSWRERLTAGAPS